MKERKERKEHNHTASENPSPQTRSKMFVLRLFLVLAANARTASSKTIKSNESEQLVFSSLEFVSFPSLQQSFKQIISSNNKIAAIPKLFEQQNGVYPAENELQLPNFGAIQPWTDILELLNEKNRKLLILIRHAQAWENLNPTENSNCEFTYNNEVIQNFDSPLSETGKEQTKQLNELFRSISPSEQSSNQNLTWFETIGLKNQLFITSPLSRTLQTSNHSLLSLPISGIIASEMIRASVGTDVCNARHSVYSSTSEHSLPSPWNTGCKLPSESLLDIYSCSSSNSQSDACQFPTLPFQFPIRPPGGDGVGLISDSDQLWRSDSVDSTHKERSLTFLNQLFEYFPDNSVIGVVTHGEMVEAVYESLGQFPYGPRNTQVVPIMIELQE